ncbi:hypothetical protein ABPG74_018502 [Tetrahymena malaccensis]
MKTSVICLFLLVSFVLSQEEPEPAKPVWPLKFSQDFIETFYGSTNHTSVGGYYYDYTTYSTRLIRSNGKYDQTCNGYKQYNETNHVCEQLIVGENRFNYYPDDNDCCWCCNEQQGCGALKPHWLQKSTFQGKTTLYGQEAYQWLIVELPNIRNIVWETTEENPLERTLLKIQRGSYDEVFLAETRRLDDFNPITVPSVCDVNNICPRGLCQYFREQAANMTAAHGHAHSH